MKIAMAMINCNRRDGTGRAVNEVAERMAGKGHEVHVLARRVEDLDLSRVHWRKVAGPGWPEAANFATYHVLANRTLSPSSYDVIHSIGCNTVRCNVVTIQNIQPAKKVILERLNGGERVSALRRMTRRLHLSLTCAAERRIYNRPVGRKPLMFLPVSRGVESELRRYYDVGRSKVRIVPNAADIEKFKPLPKAEREEWRQANGIQSGDLMALFAGGEWARKGLDFAIGAMPLVTDKRVKLYVAGDDANRDRFMQMARDLGCANRVIFGGFRSDIERVMGVADLYLFPSWYEAFSLATIEAAACGLPVIATRINGAEDFIQPGENGEFIERDAAQIAGVLNRLCAEPGQLREMGRRGRKLVEERYTWDRVAAMTEEAYREHLQEEGAE